MKYYLPLGFSSRNITKNAETHPPPMRDVIIKNADFRLEFEKTIVIFEISTLEYFDMRSSLQK